MSRRTDVLDALRAASDPQTINQLADTLGVHPNTVRFHLEALAETGLVERSQPDQHGPGRPPQLFRALRRMDPAGPTQYRILAEILVSNLSHEENPDAKALELGRAWGRGIEPMAVDATESLVALLDQFGFAPGTPADDQIPLRHCPFLDLAQTDAKVICPIHLGLMQGALQNWHAPLTVDRLDAFVEPDLCIAHLGTKPSEKGAI